MRQRIPLHYSLPMPDVAQSATAKSCQVWIMITSLNPVKGDSAETEECTHTELDYPFGDRRWEEENKITQWLMQLAP